MSIEIHEIEKIIEKSHEWHESQWARLSKDEKQLIRSKYFFVTETYHSLLKITKERDQIIHDKTKADNFNLKILLFVLIATLVSSVTLNHFSNFQFDSKFSVYFGVVIVALYVLEAHFREVVYWTKLSPNSQLRAELERDIRSCGVSRDFILRAIKHDKVLDEENNMRFENLPEQDQKRLGLISTWKKYCFSVAVLETVCDSEDLLIPPREIDHGGAFFLEY